MQNSQQLFEKYKVIKIQKLLIVYGNEKLETILSPVNVSQNSRQTIGNTHIDLQTLVMIISERFDSIKIVESNNYLMEEIKEGCQEDTKRNKQDELLFKLQRNNQRKITN